jgi:hypothetical protein
LLQVISALVAACSAAPGLVASPWALPYAHHGLYAAAPIVRLADDGQYRTGLLDSAVDLRGQYYPEAKAYVADSEGAYQADDEGSYKPDNEGAYVADAEGAYDAASAHAKEALSEDGSYKGEPLHTAIASGIVKPVAYAAAPVAYAASPVAYNAHPFAYNAPLAYNAPWAYNPLAYNAAAVLAHK